MIALIGGTGSEGMGLALPALKDYACQKDPSGYELRVTQVAAAELVMGKLERIPAAIVRGYAAPPGVGSGRQLLREPEKDLFR